MVIVDTDILIWILRDQEDIVSSFKDTVVKVKGFVYITPNVDKPHSRLKRYFLAN